MMETSKSTYGVGTGKSILRRSSVVLMRRSSLKTSATIDAFSSYLQNPSFSLNDELNQLSAHCPSPRRASIAVFGRRSSLGSSRKLNQSANLPGKLPAVLEDDDVRLASTPEPFQHHDYKSLVSLQSLDGLRDSSDMVGVSSDIDLSSQCSDVASEIYDVDGTDPSDWFLDEEMEDEPMFEILERDDIIDRMHNKVDSVASQLDITPAEASLVLQYFKWNIEDLLYHYFDRPDYYLREAGVFRRDSTLPDQETRSACKVCLEEHPAADFYALGCGHAYCKECWRQYLQEVAIESGSEVVRASCMYPRCKAKLAERDFEILALPSCLQRYLYFLLKEYSEKELHAVFCPNPTCGNAVVYSGAGRPTDVVECHCGTRFCFSCGHEKHNPVTCDKLNEWLSILQDDSESLNYIRATSKPCYHCGTFTERISGCNHMICRRGTGGCGGEWCWMCRGDWRSHGAHTGGFYSCNKYEESEAKVIDDESIQYISDKNESRFLHYYNRYFNHDAIMKDIIKQLSSKEFEESMAQFPKLSNSDPTILLEAAELLVECRRVLKYTYVYGYYMPDSPSKALFEYQQASAEGITERLSELFHAPLEEKVPPLEFVNYVRVTKKFISNLVKSIEEGFHSEQL